MSSLSAEVVDDFVHGVRHRPDDFTFGSFRVECSKTGRGYWIANGWFYYHLDKPFRVNFTAIDKFRFLKALNLLKEYHYRDTCRKGSKE